MLIKLPTDKTVTEAAAALQAAVQANHFGVMQLHNPPVQLCHRADSDAQGNSVNGTVQMEVNLYNTPSGYGTNGLLYSETIGPVSVTNGIYRFAFGGGTSGTNDTNGTGGIAAALTATNHYLALVVDGV